MGEVVNLRLARKRAARAAKDERAASNRRVHGRSKAERERAESEYDRAGRVLDGHKLDDTQSS